MKLMDLATVVRSKNASPFMTTLDLFFAEEENYQLVKGSGVLTPELIASLHKLPVEDVVGIWFVDSWLGITISNLKHYPSDHPSSSDHYGSQQSVALLEVEIEPES